MPDAALADAPGLVLTPPDVTAQRCQAITAELCAEFLERDGVIRALMTCVLAGQHALLLGPPGTAKSKLVRALTSRFTGACPWEVMLTGFTSPAKLFGPIDVAALVQGIHRQVFDGHATTAHFAFLDEIFRCSPAALDELLALLNERIYHPEAGGDPIICPLLSAIGASNELPAGEETDALFDRFLVRVQVERLAEKSSFASLLTSANRPAAAPTTIDLADLTHAVHDYVPAVSLPDPIIDILCELRDDLAGDGVVASDRRWQQATSLLRAGAFLSGRHTVNEVDLEILTSVLWQTPEQREGVNDRVLKYTNPSALKTLKVIEDVKKVIADYKALDGEAERTRRDWATHEANPKLRQYGRDLATLLTETQAAGRPTADIEEAIVLKTDTQKKILGDILDADPDMIQALL